MCISTYILNITFVYHATIFYGEGVFLNHVNMHMFKCTYHICTYIRTYINISCPNKYISIEIFWNFPVPIMQHIFVACGTSYRSIFVFENWTRKHCFHQLSPLFGDLQQTILLATIRASILVKKRIIIANLLHK